MESKRMSVVNLGSSRKGNISSVLTASLCVQPASEQQGEAKSSRLLGLLDQEAMACCTHPPMMCCLHLQVPGSEDHWALPGGRHGCTACYDAAQRPSGCHQLGQSPVELRGFCHPACCVRGECYAVPGLHHHCGLPGGCHAASYPQAVGCNCRLQVSVAPTCPLCLALQAELQRN